MPSICKVSSPITAINNSDHLANNDNDIAGLQLPLLNQLGQFILNAPEEARKQFASQCETISTAPDVFVNCNSNLNELNDRPIHRYYLSRGTCHYIHLPSIHNSHSPSGQACEEKVGCILWDNKCYISGTDIIKIIQCRMRLTEKLPKGLLGNHSPHHNHDYINGDYAPNDDEEYQKIAPCLPPLISSSSSIFGHSSIISPRVFSTSSSSSSSSSPSSTNSNSIPAVIDTTFNMALDELPKKLEEFIFSHLRSLKPGEGYQIEPTRSDLLSWMYMCGCIRTKKRQKVFYWECVDYDHLYKEVIEMMMQTGLLSSGKKAISGNEIMQSVHSKEGAFTATAIATTTKVNVNPQDPFLGTKSLPSSLFPSSLEPPDSNHCLLKEGGDVVEDLLLDSFLFPTKDDSHFLISNPISTSNEIEFYSPVALDNSITAPLASTSISDEIDDPFALRPFVDESDFIQEACMIFGGDNSNGEPEIFYDSLDPRIIGSDSSNNSGNEGDDYYQQLHHHNRHFYQHQRQYFSNNHPYLPSSSSSSGETRQTRQTSQLSHIFGLDSPTNSINANVSLSSPSINTTVGGGYSSNNPRILPNLAPFAHAQLMAQTGRDRGGGYGRPGDHHAFQTRKDHNNNNNNNNGCRDNGRQQQQQPSPLPQPVPLLPYYPMNPTLMYPHQFMNPTTISSSPFLRTGVFNTSYGHHSVIPDTRRFNCTYPGCRRRFKRGEHLKRHLRTHTGEKPYKCPVKNCGRAFGRSDNLHQHMKTHSDKDEYSSARIKVNGDPFDVAALRGVMKRNPNNGNDGGNEMIGQFGSRIINSTTTPPTSTPPPPPITTQSILQLESAINIKAAINERIVGMIQSHHQQQQQQQQQQQLQQQQPQYSRQSQFGI